MHVGMAAIFQNPGRDSGVSDYAIYQQDMRLALSAESLGFESVWGVEHHFTDYTMTPDVTQFLSFVGGQCKKNQTRHHGHRAALERSDAGRRKGRDA
jgi:hypothetical protein